MSTQNENLFVKLVKKSVGLPTGKSDCCDANADQSNDCCGSSASSDCCGDDGCGGDCCGAEDEKESESSSIGSSAI